NIDYSTYLRIKVIEDSLEFFNVDENYARNYVSGNGFSHILGYTGEVTSTEILENGGFRYGDIVGKEGLEYTYDEILRGKEGVDVREVDAMGKMISDYTLEKEPPTNGADIYLSIDSELQSKVYELLESKVKELEGTAGSAVIVDVETGKIVTLTNYPGYDNSLMVGGVSETEVEEYMAMMNDEKLPFLNRAIASAQPPGSTFKVITASALLQSGAITTKTIINCPGIIYIGGDRVPIQDFGARVHGNLNVVGAIQMSSNIFFCRATIENSSIEAIMPYLEFYGIGEKTGIDLPGEAKGTFPSPEVKKKLAENNPWVDPYWYPQGDTCLTAFGQGIVTATPLQMAMVVTAIANGGKIYQPTLVDRFVYPDGTTEINEAQVLREGVVDKSVLDIVGQGMKKSASNEGIIRVLANTPVPVAAKTGSAEYGAKDEIGRYEHVHAWVIGFFPYDDPKYAVAILLEDGKAGGNSAYVLRDVVEYMYSEN
ncbi:MAG TPA: penicillin-binding transpeptidase domain-containing protein, partial [Candidatus Dojkabacteria bacterium]|nr:penicillin-binding transpeptidase domain-containing protein [Candidatus Dojkabacteria bacterium]